MNRSSRAYGRERLRAVRHIDAVGLKRNRLETCHRLLSETFESSAQAQHRASADVRRRTRLSAQASASMKTLQEIETDVRALGKLIGASKNELPTYRTTRDMGYPHVEVANGLYHYVVVERGQELERRSSATYGDLLYWIFESATHNLAFAYELRNRIENQDCRRIAFPKQIELMKRLSSEMGARLEAKLADTLSREPYDDEPTKVANRSRRHDAG